MFCKSKKCQISQTRNIHQPVSEAQGIVLRREMESSFSLVFVVDTGFGARHSIRIGRGRGIHIANR